MHQISNKELSISKALQIIKSDEKIELSKESRSQIDTCREFLERSIAGDEVFYGINTGFGSLCNIQIPDSDLDKLQHNLVVSHACGIGDAIDEEAVKLMLLLKIQSLSYGHSGVREKTVRALIDLYNNGILPRVYEFGSLGASGDLAPLAHLSLPLLGLGKVTMNGQEMEAKSALEKCGLSPISLKAKEGLALLNGTQFMGAFGCSLVDGAKKMINKLSLIAALSIDASQAHLQPFHPLIHSVRKQPGQSVIAKAILSNLADSALSESVKEHVQDPYSFRCIPQVHGATLDAVLHVERVFTNEINSVTDNPNIFHEEGKILSGGNFHGQPLALALDYLAMALAELGSISERRTYFLVSGQRGLPDFLAADPGLHSGLMIPQYTAASLVSRNKQLTMPASTDTIDSSNGQEDHVSMGANAATKCMQIFRNLERIVAIELMTASQALHFRRPAMSSRKIEELVDRFVEDVPVITKDRLLHDDLVKATQFVSSMLA